MDTAPLATIAGTAVMVPTVADLSPVTTLGYWQLLLVEARRQPSKVLQKHAVPHQPFHHEW
ncbi:MAG: hypothetical protein R2797_07980 [Gelidibacter sp.]